MRGKKAGRNENGKSPLLTALKPLDDASGTRVSGGLSLDDELLKLFIACRGDEIALLTPDGHFMEVNRPSLGATGAAGFSDGLIGQHLSACYPPEARDRGDPDRLFERARKHVQAEDEGWLVRQDGTRYWARITLTALLTPEGGLKGYGCVARDLSDRRSSQEQQAAYARDLQKLSQRLVEAHEIERERLAIEVHEEIGQSLAALKLRLHGVLTRSDLRDSTELLASLALVDGLIQKTRSLSLDLRPRMLHDLGLKAALQWEINSCVKSSGIKVKYTHQDVPEDLDADLATGCFRIIQETISNVLRHSHATRVSISLKAQDSRLNLMIRDNGRGFELARMEMGSSGKGHLGLLGMQERARALGGRLRISSVPGYGTTIYASLPIHHRTSGRRLSGGPVSGGTLREELR